MSSSLKSYSLSWARGVVEAMTQGYCTGTEFVLRVYNIKKDFICQILQNPAPESQKAWRRWKNLVKLCDYALKARGKSEEEVLNIVFWFKEPRTYALWSTTDVPEEVLDMYTRKYTRPLHQWINLNKHLVNRFKEKIRNFPMDKNVIGALEL